MGSLNRGALIVIEGVDKSGKSTQCRELVKSLNARRIKAQLMNFPDRSTPIGGLISEYLGNKENQMCDEVIHLLFTANRWENQQKMKNLLENGATLIVDRYSYSGIVYSSVKKNMNLDWCKHPENGLLKPDLVFLLTVSEDEGSKRPGYGDERYETKEFQSKVAHAFLQLSREEDNWEVLRAEGKIEEVQDKLLNRVLARVKEVGTRPLQYLNFTN